MAPTGSTEEVDRQGYSWRSRVGRGCRLYPSSLPGPATEVIESSVDGSEHGVFESLLQFGIGFDGAWKADDSTPGEPILVIGHLRYQGAAAFGRFVAHKFKGLEGSSGTVLPCKTERESRSLRSRKAPAAEADFPERTDRESGRIARLTCVVIERRASAFRGILDLCNS